MSTTLDDHAVTSTWVDIVDTLSSVASTDTLIQNVDKSDVFVVAGGASAPTNKTGVILGYKESIQVNAANVWVRKVGSSQSGRIGVTTL